MAYVYQYGKRWSVKIPRGEIRRIVPRYHVSADYDSEIAPDLEKRMAANSGFSELLKRQVISFGHCVHFENRQLFYKVYSGN
ncbi:MAG: hypothetical protein KGI54_14565 [Pseudomonadota bacterium]|nr:hypothetical protein [Pseudomonadota bacterium]